MEGHEVETVYVCDKIILSDSVVNGAVFVNSQGKIIKVLNASEECAKFPESAKLIKISDGVLMAGVVDSHVHVNSPGRSEWEDFPCATKAAAAGGVTTIADMPLNSIPATTTLENLHVKADVARGTVFVDVAFWGGVVPNNQEMLLDMISAGVVGFKCFLCPSGVDEFPHVTEEDLEKAVQVLEKTDSVLAFHAECQMQLRMCEPDDWHHESYNTYLSTRPPEMEHKALKLIMKMAEKYHARYHIVHVSAASGARLLSQARKGGAKISTETCPHYLTLTAENIPRGATQFKCAPPVRAQENREELWNCIKEGNIDMIVSDHSPCTPELKTNNFLLAWGGISSLQFGLALVWTQASQRGFNLPQVSCLMSSSPARLCGLQGVKGSIGVGMDADLIVFNPDAKFTVTKERIFHKNKLTPYLGMELRGKVMQTYVRGQLVYDDGKFSNKPLGKLLLNGEK